MRKLPSLLLLLGVLLLLAGLFLAEPPHPTRAQTEPTPFPLYALPDARLSVAQASNTLAIGRDNITLVAANMFSNSVALINLPQTTLRAEVPVGIDPRSVALTNDGTRAVSANRGDGTLSLIDLTTRSAIPIPVGGLWPYGIVIGTNDVAYVTLQGSGEVIAVDLVTQQVTQRIPVGPFPSGIALWGDFLYVTHFWDGTVSLIYLPEGRVVQTVSSGRDTSASSAIEIDITRGLAYLPQTRSYADNPTPTFDSRILPVVNVLALHDLSLLRESRIALDTADRPVNMPLALALDRFRERIYTANAGSDSVSVIDLNTGLALANIEVGANPRGLLLNRDNSLLLVNNALDGTLSVVDTRDFNVRDNLPISDFNVPVDRLVAATLFHSASDERMQYGGAMSCANCHFDGMSDGRVWETSAGTLRNTPLLYNLLETPPYTWENTWDELADLELHLRSMQYGSGLITNSDVNESAGVPHAGRSLDLDSLTDYLATLSGPPNTLELDPAQVEQGAAVFEAQECGACHLGASGSDLQIHDVGTGSTFGTPTLRWLGLSAPYLHDGRAETLRDVFLLPGDHALVQSVSLPDIDALTIYLLSWNQ
jgi:YVTN family beta-propeller protein